MSDDVVVCHCCHHHYHHLLLLFQLPQLSSLLMMMVCVCGVCVEVFVVHLPLLRDLLLAVRKVVMMMKMMML